MPTTPTRPTRPASAGAAEPQPTLRPAAGRRGARSDQALIRDPAGAPALSLLHRAARLRAFRAAATAVLLLLAVPASAGLLDEAEAELLAGRPDAALAMLEGVGDREAGNAIQLRFLRALAYLRTGRPEAAIAELEPVLARRPELVRIRLELARAYFEAGRDGPAKRQFRQALGGDLPDEVRVNVLRFLEAIERRDRWSGSLRAAVAPDTNVSAGSEDSTITLFGQPFELDERAQKASGVGIEAAASLTRSFAAPGDRTRPEVSAGAFFREYLNDEFDDYSFWAAGGVERRVRNGGVYAGLRGLRRHFAGAPLSQTWGVELRGERRLTGRLAGFGSAFAGRRRDLRDSDREDADLVNLSAGVSYPLTERITVGGLVGLRRESAANDFDSLTRVSADASIGVELPRGFAVTAAPGISAEFHDEANPIFGEREDTRNYRATLSVANRLLSWRGFSPSVSLQYSLQQSEIALFDYDRIRLLVGVESSF